MSKLISFSMNENNSDEEILVRNEGDNQFTIVAIVDTERDSPTPDENRYMLLDAKIDLTDFMEKDEIEAATAGGKTIEEVVKDLVAGDEFDTFFSPMALNSVFTAEDKESFLKMHREDDTNYTLYNGTMKYGVTEKVQKVLEGIMYFEHCKRIDSAELARAEGVDRAKYTDAERQELQHAVNEEEASILDKMEQMEKLGVPNWVGNGAMQFGRENDLRVHYMSEFFERGKYSEKANQERMAKRKPFVDHEM